jgi:hypothetical protein
MDLDQALALIKKLVKNNGTNDTKHIDIGLVSADERPEYEKALRVAKLAIVQGKLSKEDFESQVKLN